ncbi:MAG: D-serine deaminase-like pyridoxal phosphate-dependent protein [Planctomycetota bacterium]|jgi:D-serine deaminase-like pyridoxal phosphate-dependent protein
MHLPAGDHIGMPREEIDTPVLLVDLNALEYNIEKMAAHFRETDKDLRPHSKSHKTPAIAHKQLAAGAIGITCAKLGEAEIMAEAGVHDILIANEVVGRKKIERLMLLAQRCDIMVAVDSIANLDDLEEAARVHAVKPRVLVEVNIGHNRCGALPGEKAVALAQRTAEKNNLRFAGIMGYEGHIVDLEDEEEREQGARQCLQRLVDARADIEAAGLEVGICSSSATGDYYISTSFAGITEVQAGSYALMDAAYARLGLGFKNALSVLTTVANRPTEEQVITDAGLKTLTPEHGFPLVKDRPDLECHALSEEHGRLRTLSGPCTDLHVGDLLEFIPGHGCTTVNLHDYLYGILDGHLAEVWPVSARGKVR